MAQVDGGPNGAAPSDQSSAVGGHSSLTALRELDGAGFDAQGLTKEPRQTSRWRGMHWSRRLVMVPYLWLLVVWDYSRNLTAGLRWLFSKWLQRNPGALVRAAEVLLWPAFFVYLSAVSNSANPFYINEGFPWPWVGVWLIALRYGAFAGVVGALLVLLAWYALAPTPSFPRLYFLGGAIVTLIAGEFGSLWGTRAHRQRESTRYLEDKIERLTRRLYLLKVSHDELEYEMVERPATLRDALAELSARLDTITRGSERLPGAKAMLEFLAAHAQIEAGGIFEFIDGPLTKLKRLASVGPVAEPSASDPMVTRAIESGQSVHLLDHLADRASGEQLVVVCPMFDEDDNPIGVLTINRMPFMAFNADNLRNIWVLVQGYAEYVRLRKVARPLSAAWPAAPVTLAQEFAWLQRMQQLHGIASQCLVWRARGAHASRVRAVLAELHENGGMAWRMGHGEEVNVISLVPFLTAKRSHNYQNTVRQVLLGRVGSGLDLNDVGCIEIALQHRDAWDELHAVVDAPRLAMPNESGETPS